ncbi:GNAT family N-acetyltransferase [Streptomyces sporangiiformans]|uniref:GNAT family N-acetyltransferase n=1 Tax=Streptomyces sporangiiformans TaxID=2315329 RepID=A0A505D902_9ACTN|nr:GNAT family N-acetyltransferase [Streptomyces sporangiiformans]TPQ19130.1 GNAT family N-acetyltransferase [Streptomyces sporangiiformans]
MAHVHEQLLTTPLPELHGHGLRLRSWDAESDAHTEAWLRGLTDPEFQRWNTPLKLITDIDGARDSLRSRAERAADGSGASFRVTDESTGSTLGHIGVNEINAVTRCARIGYWVLPEARGRQVATRALALVAGWALSELGLHRLELGHAQGHEASCRIAERCGFLYEGTLRGAMFEAGRYDAFRDVHLHARIATDPEPGVGQPGGGRGPGVA